MNSKVENDAWIQSLLQELKHSVLRDGQRAARARQTFLAEAGRMSPRVSNQALSRPNRWQTIFGAFRFSTRKEKGGMFNLAMTLILVFGAVLGSGATMLAAAQGAQPDDTLYPLKTWSEDARLRLTTNTQERFSLELQYAARRAEEIRNGLVSGSGVSTMLLTRFQNELREQLRLAANLPDDQITAGLAQIRTQARLQHQTMAQLQLQDPELIRMRMRVQTILQTQEQLAQAGTEDPEWLRQQFRIRRQIGTGEPTAQGTPATQATVGSGNPWTTAVPTPGSSYGPGTSQNPWTDTTPTPGSGYGPGPGTGECADCTGPSGNGAPSTESGGSGGGKGP